MTMFTHVARVGSTAVPQFGLFGQCIVRCQGNEKKLAASIVLDVILAHGLQAVALCRRTTLRTLLKSMR